MDKLKDYKVITRMQAVLKEDPPNVIESSANSGGSIKKKLGENKSKASRRNQTENINPKKAMQHAVKGTGFAVETNDCTIPVFKIPKRFAFGRVKVAVDTTQQDFYEQDTFENETHPTVSTPSTSKLQMVLKPQTLERAKLEANQRNRCVVVRSSMQKMTENYNTPAKKRRHSIGALTVSEIAN